MNDHDNLRELRRGLDMIHYGLMDSSRPRQAVGEVCAYWLGEADKMIATASSQIPVGSERGEEGQGRDPASLGSGCSAEPAPEVAALTAEANDA